MLDSFKKISKHIGIDGVNWRYDPIFIGMGFDVEKHIKCFEKIAKSLKGYTKNCTISFLDLYEKVKRNAPNIKPPTKEEQIKLAINFSKIGKENGIKVHSCCEKTYLAEYGIDCNGCMSKEIKAPELNEVLTKFKSFLREDIIVGHNVNFDINFLYDNFLNVLNEPLENNFVDTLRISRKLLPELKHHRLDDLVDYYNIKARDKHRALNDCILTNEVYIDMCNMVYEKYDDWANFKKSKK